MAEKINETLARIQETGMSLEAFKNDIMNDEQAVLGLLTDPNDPNYIDTGLTGQEARAVIEILKRLPVDTWHAEGFS